jgi:hypothetical protein
MKKNNKSFFSHILILFFLFSLVITGCKKYLEVPLPIDQLSTTTVYSTKPTVLAAINGMYSAYSESILKANYYKFTYWMSDEGEIDPLPGTEVGDIIKGNIVAANTQIIQWVFFYRVIYRANELIEKLPLVSAELLSETEKKQFIAAAKYIRAAEHFTLVNSWGDVPLTLTTSADENLTKPRTPANVVYDQIVKDLQEAAADLPTTVNTSNSRTIHNKYQALSLLSKVYLYLGRWAEAEAAATEVINSGQYLIVTGVNNVFKKGSREAIFSMGATSTGLLYDNRTILGWLTLPATAGNTTTTYCAIPAAMQARFEATDQRKVSGNWTISLFGKVFANKYLHNSSATAAMTSANPQDFICQRLAELYLIRGEARAQLNNIAGANSAATDINIIRTRAGLGNTTAATKTDMLNAIEKERVTELFYEGHRWYDLKRTNQLQTVLSAVPYKVANYKPYYNLWPIQAIELNNSPNLTQNPGY